MLPHFTVSLQHARLPVSPYHQFSIKTRVPQVAQLVKNPPAMQTTLVRFLGQEAPLEKG